MYTPRLPFRFILLPAIAGAGILLAGFTTPPPESPAITAQPQDEMVPAGSAASVAIEASHGDHYQWLRNGAVIPGQNQSRLAFGKIEIKDAGNYSCIVSRGANSVASRVAALMVYVRQHAAVAAGPSTRVEATPMDGGNPIVVYASPTLGGGSSGSCPGNYAGYVTYYKTVANGWGWAPTSGATNLIAADGGGRSDTRVEYTGKYLDEGCDQTSVAIPYPAYSSKYRFAIYFPSNVPTTNYPITLTGFNP